MNRYATFFRADEKLGMKIGVIMGRMSGNMSEALWSEPLT